VPVFLLGGTNGGDNIIMASADGSSWSTVFSNPNAQVYGTVWVWCQCFYAGMNIRTISVYEILLQSFDGWHREDKSRHNGFWLCNRIFGGTLQ
jgi:hypothetical protein